MPEYESVKIKKGVKFSMINPETGERERKQGPCSVPMTATQKEAFSDLIDHSSPVEVADVEEGKGAAPTPTPTPTPNPTPNTAGGSGTPNPTTPTTPTTPKPATGGQS